MKLTFDLSKRIIYSTILFFIIENGQSQSSYKCKSNVETMFEEEIKEHFINSLPDSTTGVFFHYQFDNDTIEVFDSNDKKIFEFNDLKTSEDERSVKVGYPWVPPAQKYPFITLVKNKKDCVVIYNSKYYRIIDVFWLNEESKWLLKYTNAPSFYNAYGGKPNP